MESRETTTKTNKKKKKKRKKNRASHTHICTMYSMNMLKMTMQRIWCWLDLKLIPSDHELGVLPCADICFMSNVYLALCCAYFHPLPLQSVIHISFPHHEPSRVAQSVAHLTQEPKVPGPIPGPAAYFRFSFRWFKKDSCQLLAKECAQSTG